MMPPLNFCTILSLAVVASQFMAATAMCPHLQAQARRRQVETSNRRSLKGFDPSAVDKLNWEGLKEDLENLLRDSQSFWPADDGFYGALMVRLAWHCAGSFRAFDGRGGCDGAHIRNFPELGWKDNTNLEKARRLLEPLKEKYGDALSWGDLITFAGNVAIEASGGPKLPFCAGRIDSEDGKGEPLLGPTPEQEAVTPCHQDGNCTFPLGQTTMGLIYVNAEGVFGDPDPVVSAAQMKLVFETMGWNAQQTVALLGGHNLGKAHGACPTDAGPGPKEDSDNPWPGTCGEGDMKGKGSNAFTSGFEGAWTLQPSDWSNDYYTNLLQYTWEVHMGPGGKYQWQPANSTYKIMMLTTDVALLHDPEYRHWVEVYSENMTLFNEDFARVWYELLTFDMGPVSRCLGPYVPRDDPEMIKNQCPLPEPADTLPDFDKIKGDIKELLEGKEYADVAAYSQVSATDNDVTSGDTINNCPYWGALFTTLSYQCASTFRATDYMGGCNGAFIRFSPEKDFPQNVGMEHVLKFLQPIKDKYDGLSYADLIVLAGTVALEAAGAETLNFCGGRTDAEEMCNRREEYLLPREYENGALVAVKDSIEVMGLTKEEAVALAGRLRSPAHQELLGYSGSWNDDPRVLTNEYFELLLSEKWEEQMSRDGFVEYKANGKEKYMTEEDLALVQDEELKAIVEQFAEDESKFKQAFKYAWVKLMNADRFDGPFGSVCKTDY